MEGRHSFIRVNSWTVVIIRRIKCPKSNMKSSKRFGDNHPRIRSRILEWSAAFVYTCACAQCRCSFEFVDGCDNKENQMSEIKYEIVKKIRLYGDALRRTRRLVLEAWDGQGQG